MSGRLEFVKTLIYLLNNLKLGHPSMTSEPLRLQVEEHFITMTTLLDSLEKKRKRKTSQLSTQEYLHINKKTTLNDRSVLCKIDTQVSKLLKTLDQVSTLNEKVFKDFLTLFLKVILSISMYQIKIDYVDLDTNLLNGYQNILVQKSSFTIMKNLVKENSPMTCLLSQTFSYLRKMVKKVQETKEKEEKKTLRKRDIKATKSQYKYLKILSGSYRYVYNFCVKYHKDLPTKKDKRQFLLNSNSPFRPMWFDREYILNKGQEDEFKFKISYDHFEGAIIDFHSNLKSSKARQKSQRSKGNRSGNITMKRKKDKFNSFRIKHRDWKNGFPFSWKTEFITKADISKDTRIVYNRSKKKWSIIEYKTNIHVDNQDDFCGNIASLDPGVRTFQTCLSTSGDIIYFGHEYRKKLLGYSNRIDSINSMLTKGIKRKYNLLKRRQRLYDKITNTSKELHYLVIKELLDNNDIILLPDFNIKSICKSLHHKPTKRALYGLGHYRFKQRLLFKASQRNKKVLIVNEAYTSKTCFNCKGITRCKDENFKCGHCDLVTSRDLNASKNIMYKNIDLIIGHIAHYA